MKMMSFAGRVTKEIVRDPLTLGFGLGFPVVLLLLLSAIQANIPVSLFEIDRLAPGMTVFGLSFLTLFSAQLIARDRESTFLLRLYTTPMKPWDFILGYTLPMVPLSLIQSLVCFATGAALGLPLNWNVIPAVLASGAAGLFFIGLGLLCGSILGVRQAGGLCGALVTNLTAWLSGIWFDLSLAGGFLEGLGEVLPFVHGVRLVQNVYAVAGGEIWKDLIWVAAYGAAMLAAAAGAFLRQMKKN